MKSLALLLVAACGVGEIPTDEDGIEAFAHVSGDTLKRVVVGRLYQKTDWTLPQAGTTPAERVAYVCNVLGKLNPTYVSGLIRLDDDAPLTADQIAVFTGIRNCLPKAKLDVVLNAEHYADPARHPNPNGAQKALDALKRRADEIKHVLHADIVFFDFFSSPYNGSDKHAGWYTGALTDGTRYIRKNLGMRVGGNVWGTELPPGSDFAALDNFRRSADVDGYEYNKRQIDAFGDRVPIMLHVENNPQKRDSEGLAWIDGTADYRRRELDKYAGDQQRVGFSYMFPVFFPLQCCVGAQCGPDRCNDNPSDRIAYDAARDGNLLQKMNEGLGR